MSDSTVKFDLNSNEPEDEIYNPPISLSAHANVPSISSYQEMYEESVKNPKIFWSKVAAHLHFESPSDYGLEWNFDCRKGNIFVNFMRGARTNLSFNCIDRMLQKGIFWICFKFLQKIKYILGQGNKIAFKWEGNCEENNYELTYEQLHKKVVEFSKVLRSKGVQKGDVVAIYMPMVIELPIAMLACSRIGAIHSVIFAGFRYVKFKQFFCYYFFSFF